MLARLGVYVDGPAIATALWKKRNSEQRKHGAAELPSAMSKRSNVPLEARRGNVFLRIPPFPGTKVHAFKELAGVRGSAEEIVSLLRDLKVGGSYWAAQPNLPERYVLVRSLESVDQARRLNSNPVVLWTDEAQSAGDVSIHGDADPWHMLSGASAVIVDEDDEIRAIAAILGVATHVRIRSTGHLEPDTVAPSEIIANWLGPSAYSDPFTGAPMSVQDAVSLCGFWRQLIDSNRGIAGGLGFAFWKRDHVAPLLWGGGDFPFLRSARDVRSQALIALWRAKTSSEDVAALDWANVRTIEVEDGFLRSRGLGADCIPPLSITVDRLGPYFDPIQPSELERLLQQGVFDDKLLDRARKVRKVIVGTGLGKYECQTGRVSRRARYGRHILVAGQVEDDRAVQSGGCGLVSNLELLARVRAQAPNAFILYKPHPDVVAGHRRGHIPERLCLQYANEIVSDIPIAAAIDIVDEVHVNTSLAGFEALLREKLVTTYGVPFYAGWGLTRDLGPVPGRRTARRTLDELVAATLLLYPRYLDPVTGLPCPAEVVVDRLCNDASVPPGLLVRIRRLQGRLMRRIRSLAE